MSYSAEVLADSPIAYWRLGEPSGTAAVDDAGSTDGEYINTPTLAVAGAISDGDTAVHLTAANSEYVLVAGLTTAPSPLSIELWLNPEGSSLSDAGLAGWRDSATLKAFLYCNFDTLEFIIASSGGAGISVSGLSELSDSDWHHIVGTFDGTDARLYLDGVLVAGPTAKTFVGGTFDAFRIGQYGPGTIGTYPTASLDEVAVYDTALSAARVAAHYAAASLVPVTVTPTTLALALTEFAPTIAVSDHKLVTPGILELELATLAPSAVVSDHKLVTPGIAELLLAMFEPTVSVGGSALLTPFSRALVLTGYPPVVSVPLEAIAGDVLNQRRPRQRYWWYRGLRWRS